MVGTGVIDAGTVGHDPTSYWGRFGAYSLGINHLSQNAIMQIPPWCRRCTKTIDIRCYRVGPRASRGETLSNAKSYRGVSDFYGRGGAS